MRINPAFVAGGPVVLGPASVGTAGQVLALNSGATQLEYITPSGGGGGGGDLLSTLTSAEISITAATTATISRMHVCSGTSADYTVTLPPVSGNVNKLIGFRMASGLTRLVTLDGDGSETIDGALTRTMWGGEAAILFCDGVSWQKIAGKTIPMAAKLTRSTAQTGILTATNTKITLATAAVNIGSMGDPTTNNRINVRRTAVYEITASWGIPSVFGDGQRIITDVWKNGLNTGTRLCINLLLSPAATQSLVCVTSTLEELTAGDFVELQVAQTTGSTQSTSTAAGFVPFLSVVEVPSW